MKNPVAPQARFVLRWAVCVALFIPAGLPSYAQIQSGHAPQSMTVERPVVFYFSASGVPSFDAIIIDLDPAVRIDAIRYRWNDQWDRATIEGRGASGSVYRLMTPGAGSSVDRIAIQLTALEPGQRGVMTITPVRTATDRRMEKDRGRPIRVALPDSRPVVRSSRRHGEFRRQDDRAGPVLTGPAISSDHSLEFWMRSAMTDQVVVTAWTGRDSDPYPFEVTIDASGHVVAYRGDGVRHVSLSSRNPVADGTWHHVAIASGVWWKLMIDGVAQDSLLVRSFSTVSHSEPMKIMMGVRYDGSLDEVRVSDRELTGRTIRTRMRQHTETLDAKPFAFESFESRSGVSTPTDLMLYRPPRDIRIQFEDSGVSLSWSAGEKKVAAFSVERADSEGKYTVQERLDVPFSSENARFEWSDPNPMPGINYYRIRQIQLSGAEIVSPPLKIGAGDMQPENILPARITGNFPNPFYPRTTVTYSVDEASDVRLSVWDLSGQLVRILADERRSPGQYEAAFMADDLPSGTYFVHLEVNGRTQTHRMVVNR